MDFGRWFKTSEFHLISEDFKSQRVKFIGQGIAPDIVDRYLAWFREIKDKKYKEIFANIPGVTVPTAQRINIDAYPTFHDLEVVVDYVKGQRDVVQAKFTDVQFDGKPIYNQNGIEIYYAATPRACIQYKGNVPYGWCIARSDASNMFYTYRFKEHEPAFYFVKDVEKTKAEFGLWNATKTAFSGNWRDKYHFFVVQVLKNANPKDQNAKQYIVTSAQNDGDNQMSWNDILRINPKLNGLENIVAPQPLSAEEKEDYNKFKDGVSNEVFAKLDYKQKNRYLDIYVKVDKPITDEQFAMLPDDLKNKYIGFGVGLSKGQYETIKQDKGMLKRYKDITLRKIDEIIKNRHNVSLTASEINIFIDAKDLNYMDKVEEVRKYDRRGVQNMVGNIDEEGLRKLDATQQHWLLKIIGDYEIPVSDPAILPKIIQIAGNYLSTDMIQYIIRFARTDMEKMQMAQEIIRLKGDELTHGDVRALLLADDDRRPLNYLNDIAEYLIKNTTVLDESDLEWVLEASNSEKLAHIIVNKYGKNISHDMIVSILSHVSNQEAVKLALQMKDKLTDEEVQHILRYANVSDEELYNVLGHHAQVMTHPDGHNWVVGTEEGGHTPHYLRGPDGKINVKISPGAEGVSIHPGGESVETLMQNALKTGGKGEKDWESWQNKILQGYNPPSKWNDYIVDFMVRYPQFAKAFNLRFGAWSVGNLTKEQKEKLFRGRPDLIPQVNMLTSDGRVWIQGTVLGESEKENNKEFTLLDNHDPILILVLHPAGNYLQAGTWVSQDPTQSYRNTDHSKYSLATAEFILKNNIEHLDTRQKSGYGWKFDDLLPEHQKMILAKYPDFLEPISFIKKISKSKKEILGHMRGFRSLELLDDDTVIMDKYDTISHENLLSKHGFLRLADSDKWSSKIVSMLDKKIHGDYGENHSYDFEKLAKQGIDPLKEKFPFADEEMLNLSKQHGYKTAEAMSHSIGTVVMPQVMKLLYSKLKPFETNEFQILFDGEKIYFVTSYDNINHEYTRNKELNALENRYKEWHNNIKIDWEEFAKGIEQIERNVDKNAFRNAISGVSKYPNTYSTRAY